VHKIRGHQVCHKVCNYYIGYENNEQQAIGDSNSEGGYGFEEDGRQEKQLGISDVGEGLPQNNVGYEGSIDSNNANDMRFKRDLESIHNSHD
jgi:hypothetical protein